MRISSGWYLLHTGARSNSGEAQASIQARVPEGVIVPDEASLPHGVIVGAIRISHSLPLESCSASVWATGPICNVIDAVCSIEVPVTHRGMLGIWPVSEDALEQVRASLGQIRPVDVSRVPPPPSTGAGAVPFPHRKRKTPSSVIVQPLSVGEMGDSTSELGRQAAKVARAAKCDLLTASAALVANSMNLSRALSQIQDRARTRVTKEDGQ